MQNYPTTLNTTGRADLVRTFMARTYSWMTAGLALSAAIAWITASNINLALQVSGMRMPLLLGQLALVFILSMFAQRIPSTIAGLLFIAYAAMTGLTLSSWLMTYDMQSVVAAFATAAGTFGAMTIAGFTIKKDLSGMGKFFMFAVLGLFVAMIVNLFIGGTALSLGISIVGVLLFAGLTVYDTQMLRNLALSGVEGEMAERASINGALQLYLDFINMFLFLLRLFGGSRD